jgi:hypothetical protein
VKKVAAIPPYSVDLSFWIQSRITLQAPRIKSKITGEKNAQENEIMQRYERRCITKLLERRHLKRCAIKGYEGSA